MPDFYGPLGAPLQISQLGNTTYTAPQILFVQTGVNFNSANTDTTFPITLPTGFTRYVLAAARISSASASLLSATFGVFTATGGGGTALVTSATACTVSTASEETANNTQNVAGAAQSTTLRVSAVPNVYFRVQTAQGSAATATVGLLVTAYP